jgi:uncharacterized protein YfiM (DUF2279 family)
MRYAATVMTADFDLAALYGAIDAQRPARGLSWAAAVRDMSSPFSRNGSRPLAASTVTGFRTKPVAEGDRVLAMLRWLGRTPESFVPGSAVDGDAARLPAAGARVLRMDTRKLDEALNAARAARGLTWEQLAREIAGKTTNTLTGLARNSRTGFPHVMRITAWLGQPLARFTRATSR